MKADVRMGFVLSAALVLSLGLTTAAAAGNGNRGGDPIELEQTVIRIEVNSTDQDAGFQIFLDGEGWQFVEVFGPDHRMVFKAATYAGIREIGGGTELFLETEEPEYETIEEFRELISMLPEGEYTFWAKTTEGEWAKGTAVLTYDVPAGPVIVEPLPAGEEECAEGVPVDAAVIAWEPVTTQLDGSGDITIVGYQVIVETDEEPPMVFSVDLPAGATMVTIPREFLEPGTEYSFEVLAIEESGNQTITERCFVTAE